MSDMVELIGERYQSTLDVIARAAKRSGRSPDSVRLVVVTKTQTLETARAAIEAGAQILGENYPEEGAMKIQSLREFSAVEWHMIGHIQSRKAQVVAQNFNFVHSLDSLKLAIRLNRYCEEFGHKLPVLLEFNVGGEESKSGWDASNEAKWPELFVDVGALLALPQLQVRGLMTMPPLGTSAEISRPYFQKLRGLRDFLKSQFRHADLSELSMGTSSDFEVAVEEGATLVRVGTAIVGPRNYNKAED